MQNGVEEAKVISMSHIPEGDNRCLDLNVGGPSCMTD